MKRSDQNIERANQEIERSSCKDIVGGSSEESVQDINEWKGKEITQEDSEVGLDTVEDDDGLGGHADLRASNESAKDPRRMETPHAGRSD